MADRNQLKKKTKELLIRYVTSPDHEQRHIEEKVFELNKSLIYNTLQSFSIPPSKYDDFFQEASRGLIDAIRRFQPNRGIEFSTFAVNTMKGVIRNGYRDNEWMLKVSRTEKEKGVRIAAIAQDPAMLEELSDDEKHIYRSLVNAQSPFELTPEIMADQTTEHDPFEDDDEELDLPSKILNTMPFNVRILAQKIFLEGYETDEICFACLKTESEVDFLLKDAIKACKETLQY